MNIDFDALGLELDDEQRQKILDAAKEQHERETQGLKSKNSELLEAQRKLKDKMQKFDGIDPERAKELEAEFERLREKQLKADGKDDELFKMRLDRETAPLKSQLEQMQSQLKEREEENKRQQGALIQSGIAVAASKAGLTPTAIKDAQRAAKDEGWTVEEGTPVLRNSDGEIVRGASGPITFEEWVESQRETSPHWFPQPKGSGAPGNRGGKAVTKKFDEMNGAELKALRNERPDEYAQLRDEFKSRQ